MAALGLLALVAWPGNAQGQSVLGGFDPSLKRLGVEHGLSHNSVLAVAQDHSGFLWFGTLDGLNRYDGREFLIHRADASNRQSLPSSAVVALLVDRDDNIWVGTRRGLVRLGQDRRLFERVSLSGAAQGDSVVASPFREPRINQLLETDTGDIWVATSAGLYRIESQSGRDVARWTARAVRLLVEPVYGLGIDSTGTVWAISHDLEGSSTIYRLDGSGTRFTAPISSRAMLFAGSDTVWLDSSGPVPISSLLSDGGAALDRQSPAVVVDAVTTSITTDDVGRIWIGTYRGTYVADNSGAIRRVTTDSSNELSDEVNTILVDGGGTVWIGTFNGVLRYDPRRKPFRHFGLEEGLSVTSVSSIVETNSGEIWAGTYGGGIARFDEESRRFVEATLRLPGEGHPCDYVWDLQPGDDGVLWIGAEDAVCERRSDGTGRLLALPSGAGQPTNLGHLDGDGLWVGAAAGLFEFDPGTRSYRQTLAASEGTLHGVDALEVAPDGAIWVASGAGVRPGALARYDPAADSWERYADPVAEGIWDIYADETRRVWLATGSGLARFQSDPQHFEMVASAGDLIGGVVFSILPDDRGRLWLGTNNGLTRYDPGAGPDGTSRRFGVSDGVSNREFNRHAALRDSRGRMWFGGMSGVTMFDPRDISDNSLPPAMVFTAITVLDAEGEHAVARTDRLVLEPDTHALTLEFAALDFTDSSRNRYEYQLEGVDPGWLDNGTRRSVRYTNLPPGTFVFRVRGTNNDGVWSETEATQLLVVLPAFWQTLWFRAAITLAVLSLLAAVYSWRMRRIHELERMRLRIASDLHDEISSELSAISLLSGMLGKRSYLPATDRDSLDEIGGTSRRVIEALRDIVWYVTPEHDNVGSMVARMQATAERLLMNIEHNIRADVANAETMIDMNQRREIVLAYKEIVNNVVRHAEAGAVEIGIEVRGDQFQMSIRDDGIGFTEGTNIDGMGLRSVRRRVGKLGGEIRISSEPTHGTSINIVVPLATTRHGQKKPSGVS